MVEELSKSNFPFRAIINDIKSNKFLEMLSDSNPNCTCQQPIEFSGSAHVLKYKNRGNKIVRCLKQCHMVKHDIACGKPLTPYMKDLVTEFVNHKLLEYKRYGDIGLELAPKVVSVDDDGNELKDKSWSVYESEFISKYNKLYPSSGHTREEFAFYPYLALTYKDRLQTVFDGCKPINIIKCEANIGCGKSHSLINALCQRCSEDNLPRAIITKTTAEADRLNSILVKSGYPIAAFIFDSFLYHNNDFVEIGIDECDLEHPGGIIYLANHAINNTVLICGDLTQIRWHTKLNFEAKFSTASYPVNQTRCLNYNFRNDMGIVIALNETFNKKMIPLNPYEMTPRASILEFDKPTPPKVKDLVLVQNDKKRFALFGKHTSNECQGNEFTDGVRFSLTIDGINNEHTNKDPYFYVALSRTKRSHQYISFEKSHPILDTFIEHYNKYFNFLKLMNVAERLMFSLLKYQPDLLHSQFQFRPTTFPVTNVNTEFINVDGIDTGLGFSPQDSIFIPPRLPTQLSNLNRVMGLDFVSCLNKLISDKPLQPITFEGSDDMSQSFPTLYKVELITLPGSFVYFFNDVFDYSDLLFKFNESLLQPNSIYYLSHSGRYLGRGLEILLFPTHHTCITRCSRGSKFDHSKTKAIVSVNVSHPYTTSRFTHLTTYESSPGVWESRYLRSLDISFAYTVVRLLGKFEVNDSYREKCLSLIHSMNTVCGNKAIDDVIEACTSYRVARGLFVHFGGPIRDRLNPNNTLAFSRHEDIGAKSFKNWRQLYYLINDLKYKFYAIHVRSHSGHLIKRRRKINVNQIVRDALSKNARRFSTAETLIWTPGDEIDSFAFQVPSDKFKLCLPPGKTKEDYIVPIPCEVRGEDEFCDEVLTEDDEWFHANDCYVDFALEFNTYDLDQLVYLILNKDGNKRWEYNCISGTPFTNCHPDGRCYRVPLECANMLEQSYGWKLRCKLPCADCKVVECFHKHDCKVRKETNKIKDIKVLNPDNTVNKTKTKQRRFAAMQNTKQEGTNLTKNNKPLSGHENITNKEKQAHCNKTHKNKLHNLLDTINHSNLNPGDKNQYKQLLLDQFSKHDDTCYCPHTPGCSQHFHELNPDYHCEKHILSNGKECFCSSPTIDEKYLSSIPIEEDLDSIIPTSLVPSSPYICEDDLPPPIDPYIHRDKIEYLDKLGNIIPYPIGSDQNYIICPHCKTKEIKYHRYIADDDREQYCNSCSNCEVCHRHQSNDLEFAYAKQCIDCFISTLDTPSTYIGNTTDGSSIGVKQDIIIDDDSSSYISETDSISSFDSITADTGNINTLSGPISPFIQEIINSKEERVRDNLKNLCVQNVLKSQSFIFHSRLNPDDADDPMNHIQVVPFEQPHHPKFQYSSHTLIDLLPLLKQYNINAFINAFHGNYHNTDSIRHSDVQRHVVINNDIGWGPTINWYGYSWLEWEPLNLTNIFSISAGKVTINWGRLYDGCESHLQQYIYPGILNESKWVSHNNNYSNINRQRMVGWFNEYYDLWKANGDVMGGPKSRLDNLNPSSSTSNSLNISLSNGMPVSSNVDIAVKTNLNTTITVASIRYIRQDNIPINLLTQLNLVSGIPESFDFQQPLYIRVRDAHLLQSLKGSFGSCFGIIDFHKTNTFKFVSYGSQAHIESSDRYDYEISFVEAMNLFTSFKVGNLVSFTETITNNVRNITVNINNTPSFTFTTHEIPQIHDLNPSITLSGQFWQELYKRIDPSSPLIIDSEQKFISRLQQMSGIHHDTNLTRSMRVATLIEEEHMLKLSFNTYRLRTLQSWMRVFDNTNSLTHTISDEQIQLINKFLSSLTPTSLEFLSNNFSNIISRLTYRNSMDQQNTTISLPTIVDSNCPLQARQLIMLLHLQSHNDITVHATDLEKFAFQVMVIPEDGRRSIWCARLGDEHRKLLVPFTPITHSITASEQQCSVTCNHDISPTNPSPLLRKLQEMNLTMEDHPNAGLSLALHNLNDPKVGLIACKRCGAYRSYSDSGPTFDINPITCPNGHTIVVDDHMIADAVIVKSGEKWETQFYNPFPNLSTETKSLSGHDISITFEDLKEIQSNNIKAITFFNFDINKIKQIQNNRFIQCGVCNYIKPYPYYSLQQNEIVKCGHGHVLIFENKICEHVKIINNNGSERIEWWDLYSSFTTKYSNDFTGSSSYYLDPDETINGPRHLQYRQHCRHQYYSNYTDSNWDYPINFSSYHLPFDHITPQDSIVVFDVKSGNRYNFKYDSDFH